MQGIYIHIPFCAHKCIYCDFYSVAGIKYRDMYVRALAEEMHRRQNEIITNELSTVYIGGGTPSILSMEQIGVLTDAVCTAVSGAEIVEYTVEMNPDDVCADKVCAFIEKGCNRVSLGVQSMVDSELVTINRRHNAQRAAEAVAILRDCGVHNISLDLMFGLPGQSLESLAFSLDKIIGLSPEHISCYGMMYEEGTLLYRMRADGRIKEVDDNTYNNMYRLVVDTLHNAGYERYEISNFARVGCESKHNSAYWNGSSYVGFGAGAHGYDGLNTRRSNCANVKQYIEALSSGDKYFDIEKETAEDVHNDYILTRMRTARGVDLNDYCRRFGISLCNDLVAKMRRSEAEMLVERVDDVYRLTPRGFMVSDTVISDLFI